MLINKCFLMTFDDRKQQNTTKTTKKKRKQIAESAMRIHNSFINLH